MTERYILASEMKELRDYIGGYIDERSDICKRLDALLASAVELPGPELREIRLAVEAIKALATSIHARVPGESQSEDDSREIVSIADRVLTLALPVPDDKLREAARSAEDGLREAFVKGAKWWEFESTKGTMWNSDQHKAWDEAKRRYPDAALTRGKLEEASHG
jgi:hypothetical protein